MFTGDHEKFSGDCSGCQREIFYIALDYDTELKYTSEGSDRENTYEFPGGNIITVDAERFRCAEMLFQPSAIGKEASAIPDTFQIIIECDAEIRKDLHVGVVSYNDVAIYQRIGEHTAKECNVR